MALDHNLDGYVLGSVATLIALACYRHLRRLPASLILFSLGCVGVAWARPALHLGLHAPVYPLLAMTKDDWWQVVHAHLCTCVPCRMYAHAVYACAYPQANDESILMAGTVPCSAPSASRHALKCGGLHSTANRGPLPGAASIGNAHGHALASVWVPALCCYVPVRAAVRAGDRDLPLDRPHGPKLLLARSLSLMPRVRRAGGPALLWGTDWLINGAARDVQDGPGRGPRPIACSWTLCVPFDCPRRPPRGVPGRKCMYIYASMHPF